MEDVLVKNINGDELSLEDVAREISRWDNPMMNLVEFHGKDSLTLEILRDIHNELGTLNYFKVEKLLVGKRMFNKAKVIKNWVKERVLKSIEDIPFTGDGIPEIEDLETYMKNVRLLLADGISDDIIDTMHAAQRHGM